MKTISIPQYVKFPNEKYPIAVDFSGKLPGGATITTGVSSSVLDSKATNSTSTILVSPTMNIVGSVATSYIQGGSSGETHTVSYRVTLSDGSILEERFSLSIQ